MMSFGFGKLAGPLHKGERFPEIAKSKRCGHHRAVPTPAPGSGNAGPSSRASGGTPPRQVFFREGLGHVTDSNVTNKCNGRRSAIDLPEHDVERTDDHRDILEEGIAERPDVIEELR